MVSNLTQLHQENPVVLSLFSGCGGLDLGFEQAGYDVGLAYDIRAPAIESHNHCLKNKSALVRDVSTIELEHIDKDYGDKFCPNGVIGAPPCQSFSRGNSSKKEKDPRTKLVEVFFDVALKIHDSRRNLDFIVMENVPEVSRADSGRLLEKEIERLEKKNFVVHSHKYNASRYGVAQTRQRLILIAINKFVPQIPWIKPAEQTETLTVRDVIAGLPEPVYYNQAKTVDSFPEHPNHWCMTPRSNKFIDGTLTSKRTNGRSFKTLHWDKASYTISYGHREVHIHPNCKRRLSVYEAMLLQGFPKSFVLKGTLSDQISQVSEAVPPPLAKAIAQSISSSIYTEYCSS